MKENRRKITISIEEKVFNGIKEYCTLNDITLSNFVSDALASHLMIAKYGNTPFANYTIPEEPKMEKETVEEKQTAQEKETIKAEIETRKNKKIILK